MIHDVLRSELRGKLLKLGKPDDARILSNEIGGLAKIWQAYVSYRSDRGSRQHISALSDYLLADIGLTRQEAEELDHQKRDTTAKGGIPG